jgi:formylglycine-generating enzyme required for sulfatase activity
LFITNTLKPMMAWPQLAILGALASVTLQAAEPTPYISDIQLTNGTARLTVQSPVGLTNRVETLPSVAQTNWSLLTNVVVTTSPYQVVDFSLTNLGSVTQRYYRVLTTLTNELIPPPSDVTLIPAGAFVMGNTVNTNEGQADELPSRNVSIGAYYIGKQEVSKALWDEVQNWALTNGYSFANTAAAKGPSHPVHRVTWYDAVKWCNARSEKEGRVPAYYVDAGQTTVYRTGIVELANDWVKWDAGYRLPTEAEWERAARGGSADTRFPWSHTNTITHAEANYFSSLTFPYPYEVSSPKGYHPAYNDGILPYTSPVGSFATNGFGLHDVAGNVWEWCWDRYDAAYYSSAPSSDPKGPDIGALRVYRGGSWGQLAEFCRTANRSFFDPSVDDLNVGLRVVLPASP